LLQAVLKTGGMSVHGWCDVDRELWTVRYVIVGTVIVPTRRSRGGGTEAGGSFGCLRGAGGGRVAR